MKNKHITALAIIFGVAVTANAAVLINDSFDGFTTSAVTSPQNSAKVGDADLNTAGWYFWNSGSSGTPWYVNTPGAAASGPGYLSGETLFNLTGTSAGTNAFKSFTPTTLANVGDSLKLSLDFRAIPKSDGTHEGSFAITLANKGSPITTNKYGGGDTTNPIRNTPFISYSQRFGTTGVDRNYLYGSSFGVSSTTVKAGNYVQVADKLDHRFTLTLTRVETGLQISSTITETDGSTTTLGTSVIATSNFTFDTLRIGTSGITTYGQFVFFDNISLTHTAAIPEPGTMALLLGGFALLVGLTTHHFTRH